MKIFQVTETLTLGGAETFVVRLANHLAQQHEVCLVVLRPDLMEASLLKSIHPSVRLLPLPLTAIRTMEKVETGLRRLGIDYSPLRSKIRAACRRLLLEHRPDVVHTHLFKSDLAFAGLKSVFPFRHITTVHGDYSAYYNGDAYAHLLALKGKMSYVLRHLDGLACLAQEHMQFFRTHFRGETDEKLRLIYNGYAAADGEAVPELPQGFRFGMVSRGVEKKGWKVLIDAFLGLNHPEAQLVLVGWSDYLAGLKAQYPHPRIHFLGAVPRPMPLIRQFDVCLLPTLFPYESLPTVIIEYLMAGRPVIATDVGEISEMIRSGSETGGLLLPFKEGKIEVETLRAHMDCLLEDSGLRQRLERGSRAAAEKFSMERCASAYLQLYGQG